MNLENAKVDEKVEEKLKEDKKYPDPK